MTGNERGVLFVVGAFEEHGGLQRRMGRLAGLLARDRPVTVLTWSGRRRPLIYRRAEGVRVLTLPSLWTWDREFRPPAGQLNSVLSILGGVGAALKVRRSWSVAYASGLDPEGLVAALAASALGRRFVLDTWLPGERGNVARLERSPFRRPVKRVLRRATAVIGGTEEVANELLACGFPASGVRVVRQGVPLDEFVPSSEAVRAAARKQLGLPRDVGLVTYHGRFDLTQKRLDVLLDAWRLADLDGWRLLLVGEGPGRAELERRCLGLPSVQPLLGWQEDVRPVLAAADLFVLPTEAEANGNAMIEAMGCGLTGIVSATLAYRRLEPPGIELVSNDPQAWAGALRRLAGDPAGRALRGKRAREWVEENYDIEQTVATLESIIETR